MEVCLTNVMVIIQKEKKEERNWGGKHFAFVQETEAQGSAAKGAKEPEAKREEREIAAKKSAEKDKEPMSVVRV